MRPDDIFREIARQREMAEKGLKALKRKSLVKELMRLWCVALGELKVESENELAVLLQRYSEDFREVKRMRQWIAHLEQFMVSEKEMAGNLCQSMEFRNREQWEHMGDFKPATLCQYVKDTLTKNISDSEKAKLLFTICGCGCGGQCREEGEKNQWFQ